MQNFIYHMPVKVYFEESGVKKYLPTEMKKYGQNVMIVYGGGSVKRNGILDELKNILEECGKRVFEFGGVASSPSYAKIKEGIALYKKEDIDLMIALGGGSVVDSTKIIAAGAETDEDIWDEQMVKHHIPEKMGKYAVVLTISGAGAEMDNLGACTNEETHEKKTFTGPYADFVIEDPSYLMSIPLRIFTPGVYDSLSHCMETYFGRGFNVWDEINESLMKNIIRNGRALMDNPDSMEIRSNLMWDSSLIQSFSFYTGNPGDFQAHGIENMLAAYTHATHGLQLAILQPVYYDHVVEDGQDVFARFAVNVMEVDPAGKTQIEVAKEGIEKLREFIRCLKLPETFSEAGIEVTEEIAAAVADTCNVSSTNVRQLSREEIREIILECR
ncbi:MAG: iron-containing alcohol dehydrogenase [Solobacterium sp.]|nr:iron-containing alcohol dehydrogenase [Solobacterium sp.]